MGKYRLIAAALISVVFMGWQVAAHAETVTLAADTWCPYNCAEGGYMVEIARDIFQKNNIDVDYRVMPWKEAVEKARDGEVDGIVGATRDDAPDFVFPASLQGMSDMRFWVRDDSPWIYSGLDSLKGVKLAVIEDYAYSKELNDYIAANKGNSARIYMASGNKPLEDNLKRLKNKEVDVVAEDDNVINYLMTAAGANYPIKSVGTPVKYEEINFNFLYIAFSPKTPNAARYARMLDDGMKQLRESGELKKILDIYHVNDWYGISKK